MKGNKMDKLLSVCMATYDDYDGVYFTTQALRMYHKVCNTDAVEFVLLDSNPSSSHGKECKKLFSGALRGRGKYISKTQGSISSFNKYETVKYASGKYILIIDCHVLLKANAIDLLLKYYQDHPNCKDLIQGPLLYDDLQNISTHFKPGWSGDMYGTWSTDKERYLAGKPFEIQMNGMGLCSFEKSNWPEILPFFKGFGAEEGYIAEKFRANGGKNMCLPFLEWNHRFGRPNGVKYPLNIEDRIWNYFIGWLEIKQDPEDEMIKSIFDYFKTRIPEQRVKIILKKAVSTLEAYKQQRSNNANTK